MICILKTSLMSHGEVMKFCYEGTALKNDRIHNVGNPSRGGVGPVVGELRALALLMVLLGIHEPRYDRTF